MQISRTTQEKILVQVYLGPLYFLIYMMFFHDPIGKVWSEKEFNATVKHKTLKEIYDIFGEPESFQVRKNDLIVLDYYDLVYPKKRDTRYKFVRIVLFNRDDAVLLPNSIYFQK